MSSSGCLASARRLHGHLAATHLEENLLIGPDPGVRFNLRFWRFLKSALPSVAWKDNYCFLQTQGYWCRANRKLFDLTGESRFRDLSLETGKAVLRMQQSEGTWTYPLPERRNLIATLEGNWAALTLLETYAQIGEQRYLQAALRWYEFLQQRIGFQKYRTGLAVNYFDRPRGNVPNNSTNTLYFLYKLAKAAGEEKLREQAGGLIRFLAEVQLPTGELPYIVESPQEARRDHYLCCQYNAFQFLELAAVYRMGEESLRKILEPLAAFLAGGVLPNGASRFNCFRPHPEVNYYTAVLGAALLEAQRLNLGHYAEPGQLNELSDNCYRRLLNRQLESGGFEYSEKDYGILRDRRSYPRYQAMILFHLLMRAKAERE